MRKDLRNLALATLVALSVGTGYALRGAGSGCDAPAKGAAETVRAAAPQTHETHTHELRREGKHMVLRRVRIDCGFAHH